MEWETKKSFVPIAYALNSTRRKKYGEFHDLLLGVPPPCPDQNEGGEFGEERGKKEGEKKALAATNRDKENYGRTKKTW